MENKDGQTESILCSECANPPILQDSDGERYVEITINCSACFRNIIRKYFLEPKQQTDNELVTG